MAIVLFPYAFPHLEQAHADGRICQTGTLATELHDAGVGAHEGKR